MAKKFVAFFNEDKAKEISDQLGIRYMVEMTSVNGGKDNPVYIFFETDDVHRLLQNKSKYSKRDYYYTSTLRF